jgi:hypothetical protein
MIEIYNPNPWETFGGMGSKKLEGDNIEYIANNDSHPGAQFNSQFRNLVKTEIAKFTAEDRLETAQADTPKPLAYAQASQPVPLEPVVDLQRQERSAPAADDHAQIAHADMPKIPAPAARVSEQRPKQQLARAAEPIRPEPAVDERAPARGNPANDRPQIARAELPKLPAPEYPAAEVQPSGVPAFVDTLSSAVNSGSLFAQRQLTVANLKDYAERTYRGARTAEMTRTASN